MVSDANVQLALERRREYLDRMRENAGRLAKAHVTWTTSGWGEFTTDKPLDFGTTFLQQPCYTHGFAIAEDKADGSAAPDLISGRFPLAQAFVYKWRQDSDDNYTGAWIGFTVQTLMWELSQGTYPVGEPIEPNYTLIHHMHFEGIAIKDLPGYLLDDF